MSLASTIPTDDLTVLAVCDPAGSRTGSKVRASASRTAFIVGGCDSMGRAFIFESLCARMTATQAKGHIYRLAEKWNPKPFYIEDNALLELWVDELIAQAAAERRAINLSHYKQPRGGSAGGDGKDLRIRTAIRTFVDEGRLILVGPHHHELLSQIETFPMNPIKDLVDALATFLTLMPKRATARSVAAETEARLAYMRQQGVDPAIIERAAQGRL